ncbi:outer membrane protein assembly factor BamD [Candidatus Poribacteria bacterium]|nr:outer membrane protein assembly factor BamD [Candidatus Poribacteria bacterium]
MLKRTLLLFILLALMFSYGCASKKENVKINYKEIDEKALEIMKIAQDHHRKKNYWRARRNYKKIVTEYPKSNYADDAQFYFAKVFFEKESYLRAKEEYEKLAEDFPASDKIKEASQDLYAIGEYYWKKDDKDDAIDAYKKAIEIYPFANFAPEVQFRIANFYFEEKEYNDSMIHFDKLLRLYPDHPAKELSEYKLGVSYFEVSLMWSLDQANTTRTIQQFKKLIELYPNSSYLYDANKKIKICKEKLAKRQYRIGTFYLNDDIYDAACIYFKNVLEEYPETDWAAYAQFGLAEILQKEQKWDNAIKAYRKLIETYPESDLIDKSIDRINEINYKIAELKK